MSEERHYPSVYRDSKGWYWSCSCATSSRHFDTKAQADSDADEHVTSMAGS